MPTRVIRGKLPRGFAELSARPSPAEVEGATAYEELFVPALFAQWAPRVVAAARIEPGQRVLDVGCGTGVLAREAARVAGADRVTGLDRAPGMLAVAARALPAATWREGTAEELPFPEASFDAVVSQFALMLVADPGAAACELLRVLVPGGRLTVAVWDALDRTPAYAAEVALVERLAGGEAGTALRAPFALGDPSRLAGLLTEAGAADVEVQAVRGTGRFPTVRLMVEAELRGWLPVVGVELAEPTIARILDEAPAALAPFTTAGGAVRFDMPALVATATRPA